MVPKLVMAPLLGYTDLVYRRTFRKHFRGIDQFLAPFLSLSDNSVPRNVTKTFDSCDIPQLLGNHPETLKNAAFKLGKLGYSVINWNLGCPVAAVAKKRRGSGLLPFPGQIRSCLEAFHQKGLPRLSIKLRLGRESSTETPEILSVLNDFPLEEVIVHPRLGTQLYLGTPSKEGFSYFVDNCIHPLSWSGDINSVFDFQDLLHSFPSLKAVYLGRGLCGNPFLGEKIRLHSSPESDLIRFSNFYNDLIKQWEIIFPHPLSLANKLKGFWEYPLASLPFTRQLWLPFKQSRTLDQVKDYINQVFLLWSQNARLEMGPFDVAILRREGLEKAG